MIFEALISHFKHKIHSEFIHSSQKFIISIGFQNLSKTNFIYQLFVDIFVKHGLQNLFVGIFDLFKHFPGCSYDLSRSKATTNFFNVIASHLFYGDDQLFDQIVFLRRALLECFILRNRVAFLTMQGCI
jgi:hypothetical protein